MKTFRNLAAVGLFLGSFVFSSHASFSSIYIWGDSISTTTNNYTPDPQYYGQRQSNGRTWVEVLAQRQGLGANSLTNVYWDYNANNLSYYYHLSSDVVTDIKNFTAPGNATNCLFVLWVNNADFVDDMTHFGAPPKGTNQASWNTAINQHIANHFSAITNLYAKGCRTLLVPNAVDVTTIPQFSGSGAAYRKFVRQQIVNFNASYTAMLNQVSGSSPGLKIYSPDIFSLLDNVEANAAVYGLTNALDYYGNTIDAISLLHPLGINGPGTNFIYWDYTSPSAAMSEVIADFCQQYLSPVRIATLKQVNGSNRLDVANMPIGLSGCLDNSTNLTTASWTLVTSFTGLAGSQSLFVPTPPLPPGFGLGGGSGGGGGGSIDPNNPGTNAPSTNAVFNSASQFYRLRFPYAWNWP